MIWIQNTKSPNIILVAVHGRKRTLCTEIKIYDVRFPGFGEGTGTSCQLGKPFSPPTIGSRWKYKNTKYIVHIFWNLSDFNFYVNGNWLEKRVWRYIQIIGHKDFSFKNIFGHSFVSVKTVTIWCVYFLKGMANNVGLRKFHIWQE